jgi:hypothetical protein
MHRAVLLLAVVGCGGNAVSSGLEIQPSSVDAGANATTTARGSWTYLSTEVDVAATLLTERGENHCVTTAKLTIDKATAAPDSFTLDATDCAVLSLTEAGDIVLYDSPTGHDWSGEPLRVDTDQELIELGPWTPAEPDAPTYRFMLAAPLCGDDCTCPFLRRRAGSEDLVSAQRKASTARPLSTRKPV